LPEGFQRSEFLLEHGLIDMIVERRKLKKSISDFLRFFTPVAEGKKEEEFTLRLKEA
jgi:acetyl-CoA carboxylase beta subunit